MTLQEENIVFPSKFESNISIGVKNKQKDISSDTWYNERLIDDGEDRCIIIRRQILYCTKSYLARDTILEINGRFSI